MQARAAASGEVALLRGLGLPAAWRDQPQWRILDLGGKGGGLDFLHAWLAWQRDPDRPRMLHYVAIGPELRHAFTQPLATVAGDAALAALARQLDAQCWGLTPGVHRLTFDAGRVLLTLGIGPANALLREQRFAADSIWLGDADAELLAPADAHAVKALARCCRRGTRVAGSAVAPALPELLVRGGFSLKLAANPGVWTTPSIATIDAEFDPRWQPRSPRAAVRQTSAAPEDVVVIGAGLAGASVAASLARRGHRVTVLDAASESAAGASSLPAGLFAPHVSLDDNQLSRLTRAGIRQTIRFAQERLADGVEWHMSGVLEVRADAAIVIGGRHGPHASGDEAARDWTGLATPSLLASAGLSLPVAALWHRRAGWIKPSALVHALLADRLISFQGGTRVDRLVAGAAGWKALGADQRLLAEAPLVVIAAGHASAELGPFDLPLQPVAGQLSFGPQPSPASACGAPAFASPPFPVNGNGSFAPAVPLASGPIWIAGATYHRGQRECDARAADHGENLDRLRLLLPQVAERLAPSFERGTWQGWTGVRCATPDRLPVVGPIDAAARPGLWIVTALGSRGLTFALLCGELLAARLHDEPLPLASRAAAALSASRFARAHRRESAV